MNTSNDILPIIFDSFKEKIRNNHSVFLFNYYRKQLHMSSVKKLTDYDINKYLLFLFNYHNQNIEEFKKEYEKYSQFI